MRKPFTIIKFQKGAGALACLVGAIIFGLYIGKIFARSSQQPEIRPVKQIVATSQINATPIDSDPMPEPDKLTQFIDNNFMLIQSKCRGVQEIIVIEGLNVLCVFGIIDANFYNDSTLDHQHFSIVYVNSRGGVVLNSMKLGAEIYKNGAYLVVDEKCYSSCANYLVPASKKLYMSKNSVILMHGSPTRNKHIYTYSILRSKNITKENFSDNLGIYDDTLQAYKDYEKKNIIPEVEFFSSIDTDEAYATRFHEISRTLRKRKDYLCKPSKGLGFIVGPEYLKEFDIEVTRTWFPEYTSKYANLLNELTNRYSLIFDFEDHPFWLSDRGLVTSLECYTSGH